MVPFIIGATLLAGTAKSVSVCGLNSAAIAQPGFARGSSRLGFTSYVVGLVLGASVISVLLTTAGLLVVVPLFPSSTTREAFLAFTALGIGLAEVAKGPSILPQIRWAVPRTWADHPSIGRGAFGLIRGVALFNHSPFASFHLWLAAMVLMPTQLAIVGIVGALAIGLGIHSVVYSALAIMGRRDATSRFNDWAWLLLSNGRRIARLDGIVIVVFAVAIFTGTWR